MACSLNNIEVIQSMSIVEISREALDTKGIKTFTFCSQRRSKFFSSSESEYLISDKFHLRPGAESTRMIESCVCSPFVRTFVRPQRNHGARSQRRVRRSTDHSWAGRDVTQRWSRLVTQTGVFHVSFVSGRNNFKLIIISSQEL